MNKLRIGILGCANIAEKHLLPALMSLPSIYNVVGIASRNIDKAHALSSKFGINAFCGYSSLLDKGLIDLIYIPLPNSMHYEWIMKALEEGIHVLVEKSLACSYNETLTITNKAREKSLAVLENFQFRFHSQLKYIIELLENDEIGDLRCIRSNFGFPPFENKNNIRYKKELGGGCVLDAGAYPVKISQIFLGKDISVRAAKKHTDQESGIDTWGGAFLSSNHSPMFSEIAYGFDNYYQCNLELWGSKGKIIAERIFTAPPEFMPQVIIETHTGKATRLLAADNHFINMLKYLYNLIEEGKFESEYKQNLNQSRLLEEIRKLS